MKKSLFAVTRAMLLVTTLCLLVQVSDAQIVNEQTRNKITVGIGLTTDIWNNVPDGINTRAINQGFQSVLMYNVAFGKSPLGFSAGVGFRVQNLFIKDAVFQSTEDSTYIQALDDSISVTRSKLTLPYLEVPIEFFYKGKTGLTIAAGFKVGYLLPAHIKYVGDNYETGSTLNYRVKYRNIQNMETFSYGPTLRVGYKWIHAFGYYSLSKIFTKDKGPDLYPISVGIMIMPY